MNPAHTRLYKFWDHMGKTPGCDACSNGPMGRRHSVSCKARQKTWEEIYDERINDGQGSPENPMDPEEEVKTEMKEEQDDTEMGPAQTTPDRPTRRVSTPKGPAKGILKRKEKVRR